MKYLQQQLKEWYFKREELQNELIYLPKGRMSLKSDGSYRQIVGTKESVIKSPEIIKEFHRKKFIQDELKDFEHNITILEKTFAKMKTESPKEKIAKYSKTYQNYPDQYFTDHHSIEKWQNEKWIQYSQYPDEKKYFADNGEAKRSMSECRFANQIIKNPNLSYRYEQQIFLNNYPYYPDFIIKNHNNGKEVIVEFFGGMYIEGYSKKAFEKIVEYHNHGFILGINFIALFPKDVENPAKIQEVLERYIL